MGQNDTISKNSLPANATLRQREVACARLGIIREIERMALIAGRERAILRLSEGSRLGDLPESTMALIPAALLTPKGVLQRRTLYRWLECYASEGIRGLMPKKREFKTPDWFADFLSHYQRPQHPTVQMAYDSFIAGFAGKPPSIHAVRRLLAKMSIVQKAHGRDTGNALLRLRPHKRRSTSELWPGDVYTADGTTFDAEVLHPFNGQPFKPEITVILDVATRRAVGVTISLSESALTVLDALRMACVNSGIPAMFYSDNGPGYVNKLMLDDRTGMLNRLGIERCSSIPGRPQGKGLMERGVKTLWVRAAQGLESYTGSLMDGQTARDNHIKSRKALKAGKRAILPDFAQFKKYIRERVEEYNRTPHKGLPRYRDGEGRWRHYSPDQFWELFNMRGFIPVTVEKDLETELFRPGEMRVTRNGWVQMFGGRYFSEELADHHGERIEVRYDIYDERRVWCWNIQGAFICEAELDGNTLPYFEGSRVEAARARREKAQLKRLEAKAGRIMPGAAISLPENEPPLEAFASVNRDMDALPAPEKPVRPRIFISQYEKYRWLMTHPDMQTIGDMAFLAEYRQGEEYANMRDLFEIEGIA